MKLLLCLIIVNITVCYGQQKYINARSKGFCNASIGLKDEWSLFNCASELSLQEKKSISFNYNSLYQLNDLNEGICSYSFKLNKFGLAFGTKILSFKAYSNSNYLAAFCYSLTPKFSIASTFDLNSERYREIDISSKLFLSNHLSCSYILNSNTLLGGSIRNLQGFFFHNEKYYPEIELGFSSVLNSQFIVAFKILQNVNQKITFYAGGEYILKDLFFFRTGCSSAQERFSYGLGFQKSGFKLDLAYLFHIRLGWSPSISISYVF